MPGLYSGYDVLGESLKHEGREVIRILRDQDDADHVTGMTHWTERHNYTDYLAWRTEHGFTAAFVAMLALPFVIRYCAKVRCGEGDAAEAPGP